MSENWQTIEQAAVTLGLSVRTVNRHITAGKLQSRLFEGRREVLVETSNSPFQSGGTRLDGFEPEDTFSLEKEVISDSGVRRPTLAVESGAGPRESFSGRSEEGDSSIRHSSARQAVTNHVISEKSLDGQMMLALADSIDDKATLAVAAYQTLARSSELQVQSLRRVAFGAWATVVVMAIGIIVAVGWGTYRLTLAESTATFLAKDVKDQKELTAKLTEVGRERERLQAEANRLRLDNEALKREAGDQSKQSAQVGAIVDLTGQIKRLIDVRTTTQPSPSPTSQPTALTQPSGSLAPGSTNLNQLPVSEVPANGPYQFSAPPTRLSTNGPASRAVVVPPARPANPNNPQGIFGVP